MRLIGTALVALLMMGNAVAATCPASKDIKEASAPSSEDGFEGYAYTAENGKWRGFAPNPDDDGTKEVELETLKLHSANNPDNPTVCRYTDGKGGGLSLSIKK